ncbi:hypothetical protein V6N13_052656 [Hibiscus sabdariffa]
MVIYPQKRYCSKWRIGSGQPPGWALFLLLGQVSKFNGCPCHRKVNVDGAVVDGRAAYGKPKTAGAGNRTYDVAYRDYKAY